MAVSRRIYTKEELRALVCPLLKKYKASNAMIFGSYARGEATEHSDIDLLIIGGQHFRLIDVFAIAEELHECSGKSVDVYELCELKKDSPLYQNAMREGVYVQ